MKVNMRDARAQLSRLVDAALRGDDVVIARAGRSCVRLVPVDQSPRQPGAARERAALTPAFFDPMADDELRRWQGG